MPLYEREKMYPWLEILPETGKNQWRQVTRVDQDMKLKLDFHRESKCYAFCNGYLINF